MNEWPTLMAAGGVLVLPPCQNDSVSGENAGVSAGCQRGGGDETGRRPLVSITSRAVKRGTGGRSDRTEQL